MPHKVFICYRRDDSGMAGRIGDSLEVEFGRDGVFLDTDSLAPGRRFDSELLRTLNESDVFIAVIGTRWLQLLQQRQKSGQVDYVVEEIKEALRLNLSVIPLLVDGAALPDESQLPVEIGHAMRWHGHNVRHESFRRDLDELSQAIHVIRATDKPQTKPIAGLIAGGSVCAFFLAGGLWYVQSGLEVSDAPDYVERGQTDFKTEDKLTGEVSAGVPNDVPIEAAQQEIKIPEIETEGIAPSVVSDATRWTDEFTIFPDSPFNLCGYESFTATVSSADNEVIINSSDGEIPGQTFRGLQWRIEPRARSVLFKGCRVLLDYETLSGTQRIRVREDRGEYK